MRPSKSLEGCNKISKISFEKGFSLIEVTVSIGILSMLVVGMSSNVVYYSKMRANILNLRKVHTLAESILTNFKSQNSCNRIIRSTFGNLPYRVYSTMFNVKTISIDGRKLDLKKKQTDIPSLPTSYLYEIAINLSGTPLPGQQISRGEVVVRYGLKNNDLVYKKSSLIFFKLNESGDIVSCMDSLGYAELEWLNAGCHRMGGTLRVSKTGEGQCDLSASNVVKTRTCDSMGLAKRGGRCDLK